MICKRVLVTGANGYIGCHVVKELLSRGYEVVACDLKFDDDFPQTERLLADIFDPNKNVYCLAGSPDTLIHLAWRNGFQHNADTHFEDLPRHLAFLVGMIDSGVRNVSVMGSMHEVGYWEGPIRNDSPANPLSYYGIAKNALRQAFEILAIERKISYHWLRGFYVYGDDHKNHSVLSKILEADKEGKTMFPFTSGKNQYDFISVSEMAKQIVSVTVQDRFLGTVNCCSGIPVSLGEMAERFIAEHGLSISLQYGAFPDRDYDSPGVWGDASIIKEIMKLENNEVHVF